MFFGKKLKELRLKYAKMGLRKFAKNVDMLPSEYSKIEHGYIEPPSDGEWLHNIAEKLGLKTHSPEEMSIYILWNEPFVMQEMDEDVFIPHATATDGHILSAEELTNLSSYISNYAKEHNKKADEYNGK